MFICSNISVRKKYASILQILLYRLSAHKLNTNSLNFQKFRPDTHRLYSNPALRSTLQENILRSDDRW